MQCLKRILKPFKVILLTLGDVIYPTKIIKKPSLSPKLSPLDNSIIEVPSNRSYIQFAFEKKIWIKLPFEKKICYGIDSVNSMYDPESLKVRSYQTSSL